MSYLKPVETNTLTLPSSPADATFTVQMKRRATYGDQSRAQSAMLKIDSAAGVISDIEWGTYIQALIVSLIVSWTLTDENDQLLPITTASLNRLDAEDGQFLASEASKRAALRGEEQQHPFKKPSLSPSTNSA